MRRGTATLLSGSGVALVLTFGLQPVLTRLYSPSAFGVADIFVSLAAILLPVASMKYEDAIMIPEERREASEVLGLSASITLVVAAVLSAILSFRHSIAGAIGSPALAPWLILLPLAVLVYRGTELAELWMVRSKAFGVASASSVVRATTMGGVRVGAGAAAAATNPAGLIWGFIAGYVGALAALLLPRIRTVAALIRQLRPTSMLQAAHRFRRFPLYTMPASLIGAAAGRLPFLLLLFYFDEATVGLFGRAFTAIVVPLTLVGSAVARSFFVHAAEAHRDGRLAGTTARVHDRLVMLAVFPVVAVLLAGPTLFSTVFGTDWESAGHLARAAVVWFALAAIASPLTRVFDILERQRTDLVIAVIAFAALAAAFVIGSTTGDALKAVWVGATGGAVARIFQLMGIFRAAGVDVRATLKSYVRYLLYSVPAATLIAVSVVALPPIGVLAVTASGAALYALLCLRELNSGK